MHIEQIRRQYPNIDLEELLPLFPEIPLSEYPTELAGYSRGDVYAGALAPGGLLMACDMARKMDLSPGMRLLDIGPGNGASSVFLARHYGVRVTAGEYWIDPTDIWRRAVQAHCGDLVMPMKIDARVMPFAAQYFDAVFSLDAFAYFMTDDCYPAYLAEFVGIGGRLCIGGACYTRELTEDTPKDLMWPMSYAYHSPAWWRRHFEKSGAWRVTSCEEHPKGRELWLDDTRRCLEQCHPRDMDETTRDSVLQSIVMLLADREHLLSHFVMVAERRESPRLQQGHVMTPPVPD